MTISPRLYEHYQPIFTRIASKVTADEALREDCVSEAWLSVRKLRGEEIRVNRDAYIRATARFAMLSYLKSYNTGDWYVGRDGAPARFVRIDALLGNGAMQMSSKGQVVAGENVRPGKKYMTRGLYYGGAVAVLAR